MLNGLFLLNSAAAVAKDPYFPYVTLLLPGNGSNGAQNNTFLDSSTNNFTITRNGNTTQGSFSPYGSYWSNYFDGSGDYLSTPANAAFAFGTGDFTVEFWFNTPTYRTSGGYYTCFLALGNYTNSPYFRINQDGRLTAGITASYEYYTTSTVQLNTWTHFAVTRSGSTIRLFVNGVLENTQTNSISLSNSLDTYVGTSSWLPSNETFTGYLSNVRIVKGTAVYTSNFTPPTSALTAITNTSLLTCQSNRFIDNSSNAFAITVNGNTSVSRFSPFSPASAYSTTANGGSAYFDGSGDYLQSNQSAYAFGTGDWTVEFWFYAQPTWTAATYDQIVGTIGTDASSGGWRIGSNFGGNGRTLWFTFTNGSYNDIWASANISDSAWHHIAVVRQSGTVRLYRDGVQTASGACSVDFTKTNLLVARTEQNSYSGETQCLVANLRIVKGTAVYTSAFTPPTAPVTAISGTSLLLNATNAAIFDNAMINDLETVGNAQVSTAQSKFGGSSMYFDGTGDVLLVPHSDLLVMDAGDFTAEFWVNLNSKSAYSVIVNKTGQASVSVSNWIVQLNASGTAFVLAIGQTSSSGVGSWISTSLLTSTTNPSTGTWYHVAVTKAGTTYRMFVNGTQEATATNASVPSDARMGMLSIGADINPSSANLNGYIDDLRITKGVARYTANFTPPTAAFPVQ